MIKLCVWNVIVSTVCVKLLLIFPLCFVSAGSTALVLRWWLCRRWVIQARLPSRRRAVEITGAVMIGSTWTQLKIHFVIKIYINEYLSNNQLIWEMSCNSKPLRKCLPQQWLSTLFLSYFNFFLTIFGYFIKCFWLFIWKVTNKKLQLISMSHLSQEEKGINRIYWCI